MSLRQTIEQRSIPVPFAGCWIWLGPVRARGYGAVYDATKKKTVIAHRASYEVYKGPIGEGLFVCHTCDMPSCVNPDHLFLGTHQDNSNDAVKKGRSRKGHYPYNTVLSSKQVLAIFEDSRPYAQISAEFNVASSTISQIKSGDQWSIVTGKQYERKEKTHCAKGHPWVLENISISSGRKYCKLCNRLRSSENHYKRKLSGGSHAVW